MNTTFDVTSYMIALPEEITAAVQERVDALLQADAVRTSMVEQNAQGRTDEDIRHWLVSIAIGTLYGKAS
jgi:hypothetical protein